MSRADKLVQGSGVATQHAATSGGARTTSRTRPELDRHLVTTLRDRSAPDTRTTQARRSPAEIRRSELDLRVVDAPARESVSPARETRVLIPRHVETRESEAPAGHRICPSPQAGAAPRLLRQTVSLATCEQRQCGNYHKCAGCVHADKPQWAGRELDALDNSPSALAEHRRQSAAAAQPRRGNKK